MPTTAPPPGATPRSDQPDPLVGRTLAGDLRVLARLGETDEGLLYQAEYTAPRREVAVAVLPPRVWERLHQASRIRHPNVAGIEAVGHTPDGITYAVLEPLEGELLSDVLAERGRLPRHEAVDLFRQAAAGLQAAHEAGIVHGNLSPHTVLVTQAADGRPAVKLIGFALAALLGGQGAGRPIAGGPGAEYASPERLAGQAPDVVSDVFSLGAVLHHLLTGAAPGGKQALRARGAMSKGVRAVVAKALARSPAERFLSVAEFADALKSVRRRRSSARKRRALTLAASIAVAVAAGVWLRTRPTASEPTRLPVARETGAAPSAPKPPLRLATRPAAKPAARPTAPPAARATTPSPARNPRPAAGPASAPRAPSAPISASGQQGSTSASRAPATRAPAATGGVASRSAPRAARAAAPRPVAPSESAPPTNLSPFRRSHPWAAAPTGRVYFPSSCPLALESQELIYFRSEAEARASGRQRSDAPGCS